MLLRIAQRECRRRSPRLRITGPELEDLAYQAAADALVAITRKLGQFRGENRFTTWAYKFVILEVSDKIGRHFWQNPGVRLDAADWDRLPDRFGFEPAREAEWRDLLAALRRAVDTELSARQRQVFVALVVNAVPRPGAVLDGTWSGYALPLACMLPGRLIEAISMAPAATNSCGVNHPARWGSAPSSWSVPPVR